jgi:CTP:molybdopterin cytidylyltransferase MocA
MVNSRRPVFAVVLAAGRGERFGGTKQLADIGGQPLVRHTCQLARAACGEHTLLVTGHDSAAVLRAAGDDVGFVVVNEHHDDGIGSSIAAGVRSLAHAAGGILLLLADQPLVTMTHLQNLIARWGGGDHEIIATSFSDVVGPPVLFPPGAFPELSKLSGDRGARSLLHDARFELKTVACEDAAVDIDTPDQLDQLRTIARSRPPGPGD